MQKLYVSEYHPQTGGFHIQTLKESIAYNVGVLGMVTKRVIVNMYVYG